MTDKEIGSILDALSVLNTRFDRTEQKLDHLRDAFLTHPMQCKADLDTRYVTFERFSPIEKAYDSLIGKLWAIMGTALFLAICAMLVIAIKADIIKAL